MELTDDYLTLRPPVAADAPAVAAAVQLSLEELEPWMPWATEDYDVNGALEWINGEIEPSHSFVIVHRDTEIVGTCGLNGFDDLNRSANLGYWVRSDQTHKGYATTAAKLLAKFAFSETDLHRLEIVMSVRNVASKRVAERVGATYEGLLRGRLFLRGEFHDANLFSLLPGDLEEIDFPR